MSRTKLGWKSLVVTGLALSGLFAMTPAPGKAYIFLETLDRSSRLGYGSLLDHLVYSIDAAVKGTT